jgi:hypothetical protein
MEKFIFHVLYIIFQSQTTTHIQMHLERKGLMIGRGSIGLQGKFKPYNHQESAFIDHGST